MPTLPERKSVVLSSASPIYPKEKNQCYSTPTYSKYKFGIVQSNPRPLYVRKKCGVESNAILVYPKDNISVV